MRRDIQCPQAGTDSCVLHVHDTNHTPTDSGASAILYQLLVYQMANDGTERRIIGIMDGTKHYGDRGENLITNNTPAPGIAGVL